MFISKLRRKLFRTGTTCARQCRKFVLLFQGRTGSTYINDRVNAHPAVRMEPEVWGGWGFQLSPDAIFDHIAKQQAWLTAFYEGQHPREIKAIGFKTKLDDVLDKRWFISYLRSQRMDIIHLTRRNLVKLVISEINAKRLFNTAATWNLEDERKRPGSFVLDLERFAEQLRWREQIEQWLAGYVNMLNLPTLTMYYEDLLVDEGPFFSRLYEFLGVPFADTKGKTFKNTPNDLRDVIENYDQLLARYKYTIYEPMIIEV